MLSSSSGTISVHASVAPDTLDQAPDGVGVRVADRAWPKRLAGLEQLVAGGQHSHPGPAPADEARPVDRGQHAGLGGTDLGAGLQHPIAGGDVLARAPDVGSLEGRRPDRDTPAYSVRVLDPDDGVRAVGQDRAGRDRDCLAGLDAAVRGRARRATRRPPRAPPATARSPRRCPRLAPRSRPSPSCRRRESPRRWSPARRAPCRAPRGARPARARAARCARGPACGPARSRSARSRRSAGG